ncbi:MAG: NUDIX hydrolase [Actinomycetes bacterium]
MAAEPTRDQRFHKHSERALYQGHVIGLGIGSFSAPDGIVFERDIVHHPGAVSIVPILDDHVVMLRQYRAAIDGLLLEIPAGKRDIPGEPPEQTAYRELEEEVGYRAGSLIKLAEFYNSPGFCDELSFVYLGSELVDVPSDAQGVEEEHMTIERVPIDEIAGLIQSAAICDAKSIIGLTLALRHLGR